MGDEAKLDDRGEILEWYRLDESRRILGMLALGTLLLLLGSLIFAWGISGLGLALGTRLTVTVAGVLVTASGPICSLTLLTRLMKREAYLILYSQGYADRTTTAELWVPWDSLEAIAYHKERASIMLSNRNGEQSFMRARFSGVSLEVLARRLEEVRRKAVWNVLDSLPPQPGLRASSSS